MNTFIRKHITNNGRFKTGAGWPAEIDVPNCTDEKIMGYVLCAHGYRMPIEWHNDGTPVKLPTNHGLNLVPLREVISYEVIPIEERV